MRNRVYAQLQRAKEDTTPRVTVSLRDGESLVGGTAMSYCGRCGHGLDTGGYCTNAACVQSVSASNIASAEIARLTVERDAAKAFGQSALDDWQAEIALRQKCEADRDRALALLRQLRPSVANASEDSHRETRVANQRLLAEIDALLEDK